jgi:hypothetical protein
MNPKSLAKRKASFCQALIGNAGNVTRACTVVKVNRQRVYEWRDEDPEFDKAFLAAREQGAEVLEDEIRRRAYEGVERPLIHDGKQVKIGRKPATVRTYSDTLAIFLLKGAMPEKYRERQETKHEAGVSLAELIAQSFHTPKPDAPG